MLAEAFRDLVSRPLMATLLVVVAAATFSATVHLQVSDHLDAEAARDAVTLDSDFVVSAYSATGGTFTPAIVEFTSEALSPDWWVAYRPSFDGRTSGSQRVVSIRSFVGANLTAVGVPDTPEWLGLSSGPLDVGADLSPVVVRAIESDTTFHATAPSEPFSTRALGLDDGEVMLPSSDNDPSGFREVRFGYTNIDDAISAAESIAPVISPQAPDQVIISPSQGALEGIRRDLTQVDSTTQRTLIGTVLASGAIAGALRAVFDGFRVREFARRRALGARRGVLVGLILTQSVMVQVAGLAAASGFSVGLHLGLERSIPLAQVHLLTAVASFGVLCAVAFSTPSIVIATKADPARILRVP